MHGMKFGWGVVLAVAACSNAAVEQDSATDSGGSSGTPTAPTSNDTSAGGTFGSLSDSQTSDDPPPTSTSGIGSSSTFPSSTTMELMPETTTGMTGMGMETDSGTGTGGTTEDTGNEGSGTTVDPDMSSTGEASDTSTTESGCVPMLEVCNGLDDDCDNNIDNVDVGMDGICDCLRIALVGNEGANPSAEFQAWLEAQGTSVDRINSIVLNDINAPITPAVLANYDIVIVDYLARLYSAQEAADIRAWVEAGGGLMSMTGHTNTQALTDMHNSIIGTTGLSYNTSAGWFSGPVTQFQPHAITMGLTSISFYGGLFVNIVDDGVGVNQTIMTLQPGPVGVVQDRLEGRVFVFGDEWVEFDSEWQNMPEIQKFWVQTLAFLGPKNSCLVPQ